ncbi:MAG: Hpt domain-containing protein [Rhodospirillales bacterium]|nr:Hpt domain-containing protein [Rhodospirillales bacterium]
MTDFEAELLELKKQFSEQLASRLSKIQSAWEILCDGGSNEPTTNEAWVNLRHHVHFLAGSAATFGFAGLGTVAADLEPVLDKAVTDGSASIADQWTVVAARIEKLLHG